MDTPFFYPEKNITSQIVFSSQEQEEKNKVYYSNQDKRENLYKTEQWTDQNFAQKVLEQARSVACLVEEKHLDPPLYYQHSHHVNTLALHIQNVKQAEFVGNFSQEPSFGFGTLFLIGKQLALTAAHCVCKKNSENLDPNEQLLDKKIISTYFVVFGFQMTSESSYPKQFPKKDVYKIKDVVKHQLARKGNWADWAILQLDREVEDRVPLPLNFIHKSAKEIELYMLGHPQGLPMKFTGGARLLENTHEDYFQSDLDAFEGNSGSPVMNKKTGEVIGILCSGHADLEYFQEGNRRKIRVRQITQADITTRGREKCQSIYRLPLENILCCSDLILSSLKSNYKGKNSITTFFGEPITIDENFPELVLLHDKEKKMDQETQERGFTERRVNSWEDIQTGKEPIAIDKLFEKGEQEEKDPRRLYILGRAGIGKSTLCQLLAYLWAHGKLWQERFHAVLLVPLRNLQNVESQDAEEFLFSACFANKQMFDLIGFKEYIQSHKHRILFLLDGLDEVDLKKGSKQKAIVDDLLQYPNWIVTSRPHAGHYKTQDKITRTTIVPDKIIENVGFSTKTIRSYIHNNHPIDSQKILEKIQHNPLLFGLCHIPINLHLICSVITDSHLDVSSLQTMSALYTQLVFKLYQKFCKEKQGAANFEDLTITYMNDDEMILFLEAMAWTALEQDKIIFSFGNRNLRQDPKLKAYISNPTQAKKIFTLIHQSGFVQSSGTSEDFLDNDYSFLHLTFQEFFAARYLANLFLSQDTKMQAVPLIQEIKFNPKYKIVIWFVAGLLKKNEDALNAFFDALDYPKDIIGLYFTLLKVCCLEECEWSNQIKKLNSYKQEIQDLCSRVSTLKFREKEMNHVQRTFATCYKASKLLITALGERCCKTPLEVGRLVSVGRFYPQLTLTELEKCLLVYLGHYGSDDLFVGVLRFMIAAHPEYTLSWLKEIKDIFEKISAYKEYDKARFPYTIPPVFVIKNNLRRVIDVVLEIPRKPKTIRPTIEHSKKDKKPKSRTSLKNGPQRVP